MTLPRLLPYLLKNEVVKWCSLSHSVFLSLKSHSHNFRWSCDRWAPRQIWLGGSLGSCYDIMSPEMLVGGWFWRTSLACISCHLYYAMDSLLGDLAAKWQLGKDAHSFYRKAPQTWKFVKGRQTILKHFPLLVCSGFLSWARKQGRTQKWKLVLDLTCDGGRNPLALFSRLVLKSSCSGMEQLHEPALPPQECSKRNPVWKLGREII